MIATKSFLYTTRPKQFSNALWQELKIILQAYSELFINEILPIFKINILFSYKNNFLNKIADKYNAKELYDVNDFLDKVLEEYMQYAIEKEYYESCCNIQKFLLK
jgi:predicted nucleotidyltransferase component of viral defense system